MEKQMADTTADVLVQRLIEWGVDTVFGLPGDGINGVIEALRKRRDTIRFIHVRHEEAAALMACGYAKFTGRLGVCVAVFLGNPQYGVELEPIDHVKFAEACGGRGFRIDDPSQCAQLLQQEFATPRPVIAEADEH